MEGCAGSETHGRHDERHDDRASKRDNHDDEQYCHDSAHDNFSTETILAQVLRQFRAAVAVATVCRSYEWCDPDDINVLVHPCLESDHMYQDKQ